MRNFQLTNRLSSDIRILVIALMILASPAAHAESEWYAGGGLGYTDYDSDNIEADLTERQTPGSSTLRDDDIPWHVFAGYQRNRFLAFEIGYQYLDKQTGTTILQSQPTVNADTSRETDGFLFSVNGILPLKNNYSVQAMGGMYLWHVVSAVNSLSGGGAIAINFDDRTAEPFIGVGFQYYPADDMAIHIRWLDLSIDDEHASVINIGFSHQFSLTVK